MKKFIIGIVLGVLLTAGISYATFVQPQIIVQGGMKKSLTTDILQQETLELILIELKKINLHNQMVTGQTVTEADIQ